MSLSRSPVPQRRAETASPAPQDPRPRLPRVPRLLRRLRRSDGSACGLDDLAEALAARNAQLRTDLALARGEAARCATHEQGALRALAAARGIAALLAKINHVIAKAESEEQMLAQACALAVEAGGFELAWIATPDPQGWFRSLAASGAMTYLEQVRTSIDPAIAEGRGCMGSTWRDGIAHFNASIQAAESMRPWKDWASRHGLGAVGALPVRRDGRMWAVMAVYHRMEGLFDGDTRAVLEELAESLSRGIDRVAMDARQRQNDLLRQILLDNAVAGVTMTQGNRIVSANARFAEMLGYTGIDELVGHPTLSLYADRTEFQRIHDLYPRMYESGAAQLLSVHLKCRDGGLISCDLSGRLLPQPQGKPIAVWTVVDVTQRDEQTERLRKLEADAAFHAHHDALTGLPNRYALEQYLPGAIADAQRHASALVVGLIDLDDFKPVNDTYGHAAGDALLRQFAGRAKSVLRGSDFLARMGGDEFVVVLKGIDPVDAWKGAMPAIRRLHGCIATPFEVARDQLATVRMTLGAALYPDDGADAAALLRVADAAMYRSKARKGERAHWWCLGHADV